MDDEKQYFERLVTRYLNGKLDDNEYDLLLGILQEDEKATWFYSLKDNWSPDKDPRSAANWERLARRIEHGSSVDTGNQIHHSYKNDRKRKRYVGWQWMYRIAAVIVIGLLAATTIVLVQPNDSIMSGITTVETPRGEKTKVNLPDGTEVWLNASSKLSYRSFSKKSRSVNLTGEAYFNVEKSDNAPFTVHTPKCAIEVRGTGFNVMAYDELERNEVQLFEGKVNVYTNNETIQLNAGEELIIAGNSVKIRESVVNQSFWVDNKLNFNKVHLKELIFRLENWYDCDIECINPLKKEVVLTGIFKNEETIWQVLDAISVYIPLSYEKADTRKIDITIK